MKGLFLTGFLGSGKTTLATRLIGHALQQGRSVSCIANEIGAINIDAARIVREFPGIRVEDLSNACIGCNGAEQFYPLVERLHCEGTELLLIEPTGILTGHEIAQIIKDCELWCDFKVITLVRVPRFLAVGAIEKSEEATASQLKLADIVGLTWCNYLDKFKGIDDSRLDPVHEFIGVYAPGVKTLVIPDGGDPLSLSFIEEIFLFEQRGKELDIHDHEHGNPHASLFTWSFKLRSELGIQDFFGTLGSNMKHIVRAKGDIGKERFDWVEGSLKIGSLEQAGRQEATIIARAEIPAEIIEILSAGPGTPTAPSLEQTEAAIQELLLNTAPIQPSPTTVLPLDGQTYLAYSLSRKEGVSEDLRSTVLRIVVERLVKACTIMRALPDIDPSAKRGAGAFLCFFVSAHEKEVPMELRKAAKDADPVMLTAGGLLALDVIGSGTGIMGAAVRPSFLKHVLKFARTYTPETLLELIRAFRHTRSIALPDDCAAWDELLLSGESI